MRKLTMSLTLLGLLTSVAAAQPTGSPPAPPEVPPPAAPAEPLPPEPPPSTPTPTPTSTPTPDQPPAEPEVIVAPPAKPVAGFDKGFFLRSEDGKYALTITGRLQPFFNVHRVEDAKGIDYKNAFEVRRARVVLDGNLHGKRLTYKLQTDFGKGVVSVKDAHLDVELKKELWLRFGQWKRPFSRQQINSSGRLELTDRAITDKAFGGGRDVGIALRNNYEKSPDVEWTVGVFNGTGEAPKLSGSVTTDPMTGMGTLGTTTNTNVPGKFKPAVIGRVGLNRNKLKGYSEADLEGGPLRWGVGASVWLEGDFDDDKKSSHKAELDYIVKVNGLSTTGGLYAMTAQKSGDTNVLDAETALVGFHLQGGYMLDKKWQAVARYAYTNDPRQKAKTAADQQEISIGASFFGHGHDAKFQGGLRFIKTGDAKFTDAILFDLGANIGW